MEKIKGLYDEYLDQIIAWYDGLQEMYQYGVLFLLIVLGLFVMAYVILSRITK
jgi:hypothetical protein